MASAKRKFGSPTGSVVFLLALSLLVTGGLAWQATDAVRSHEAVVANVLRDYAMLAAGEFVRRTANQVGYYGYYPVSVELARAATSDPLPTVAQLTTSGNEQLRQASELVRYTFRWNPVDGSFDALAEGPPDAIRAWLVRQLREAKPDERGAYHVIHGEFDGEQHAFVIGSPAVSEDEPHHLVGFEVRSEALPAWLLRAFDQGPLLPSSLAKGKQTNEFVSVALVGSDGREVFRVGYPNASYFAIQRPYGDAQRGVFNDFVVHAAIDPAAAPDLAIGGLPRSRLPILAALIVLTVGLLLTAIRQLRRENAVMQLRSDFVSRVSHELRTPLTQIRMFGETLLLERVRTDDERRRSLEIIDREARRLSNLVENILQFSRSERGTIRLAPRERSLGPLMRNLIDEFAPIADSDDVKIRLDSLANPRLLLDEEAFRQVVFNLLDNAVKYGPSGQTIRIVTEIEGGCVRIAFEDDGPGVPEKFRDEIWAPFHRLERDRESATAGTGIGLSVVRDLVDLHSGACWVESGPDRGARFVVELPVVDTAETDLASSETFATGCAE